MILRPKSESSDDANLGERRPRIGVLALQGDFAAHIRALERAGAAAREVRVPRDLTGLDGCVLPGGESTAWLRLMKPERMDDALRDFHDRGGFLFGTCAGLIVLSRRVTAPEQECLGLIDLTIERNAYGRQVDSFVGRGVLQFPGSDPTTEEMVCIRAPRIRAVGPAVEVLGNLDGEAMLVREDRILGATFHPEMSVPNLVHPHFVAMISESRKTGMSVPSGEPGP